MQTDDLAKGMMQRFGLQPGDQVLIIANTRREWMLTSIAVFKTRGTLVTFLPVLSPDVLCTGLAKCKPKLIVTENYHLEKLLEVSKLLPSLADVPFMCLDDFAFGVFFSPSGACRRCLCQSCLRLCR